MYDLWKQWESVHDEPDQLKRQESACAAKLTPLSIDKERGVGIFKGSREYCTALDSCQCTDWGMRKKPCKHMYRLAFELGVMETPEKVELISSNNAGKDWRDFVFEIEKYSDDVQLWFAKHLFSGCGKKSHHVKKKDAVDLLATGLVSKEKETPKLIYCLIDPLLAEKWQNVSRYFNRKFHGCHDIRFDEESGMMVEFQKPLPDDAVAELLRKNGFADRWEL